MTAERSDRNETGTTPHSADELCEKLEPFEPYTTNELADKFDADQGIIRKFLDKLNREGKVKKKKPKSSPTIWARKPPVNSCSKCGRQFEIKIMHPVFSSAQFCPRCGNRL